MTLGKAPVKPATCRDLGKCDPRLRAKLEALLADAKGQGLRLVVAETLRSDELALWYWQSGREFEGPILTQKNPRKGQRSRHCANAQGLSEAADVLVLSKNGVAKDGDAGWKILGMLARKNGLVWGGDWVFRDMPHVELPKEE